MINDLNNVRVMVRVRFMVIWPECIKVPQLKYSTSKTGVCNGL